MRLSVLQSDSSFTPLSVCLVSNTQICEHFETQTTKEEKPCGVEKANELRKTPCPSDHDHPTLSKLEAGQL